MRECGIGQFFHPLLQGVRMLQACGNVVVDFPTELQVKSTLIPALLVSLAVHAFFSFRFLVAWD